MRFQRLAVLTCAMGTLTVNINNTALNLALPSIRNELELDLSTMQWVSATYVLVLAALTMLGGALGDRFNKRTVLLVGLVIYTLGSVLGAMAPTGDVLVLSRVLAAIGAAVLVPVGLAVLRVLAQTPQQLASYMATWGLSVGLGMALGPVAGGMLTSLLGWRSFFIAMVLLGVVFFIAVSSFLPSLPGSKDRGIDLPSHFLLAVAMFAVTALFIEMESGVLGLVLVGLGALAALAAAFWLWMNRRARHPVVPPQAMTDRSFSTSMLIAFANYLCLGITLFVSALLLQDLMGIGPGAAGAVSIPLAAATAVGARWAGSATTTPAAKRVVRLAGTAIILGVVVVALGVVFLELRDATWVPLTAFILGTLLMGLGFGAANTPVNFLAMTSLPKGISGAAGSSASASRQLGQSVVSSGGCNTG